MSYADVAAHNAPPPSEQPKPEQGLLNTDAPGASGVAADAAKVTLVAPESARDPAPATRTSVAGPSGPGDEDENEEEGGDVSAPDSEKRRRRAEKKQVRKAEEEVESLWARVKEQLGRPGVAGGLVGVANVSILAYGSYVLCSTPSLRREPARALCAAGAGLLALVGLEGCAAAAHFAPRREGEGEGEVHVRHRRAREAALRMRPGVLVGLLNAGVLGGVGYAAYANWGRPSWDRRVVGAVGVGLLGLWGGEGFLAEKYRASRK